MGKPCVPARASDRSKDALQAAKKVLQQKRDQNQKIINRKQSQAIYRSANKKTETVVSSRYAQQTDTIPFPFSWKYKETAPQTLKTGVSVQYQSIEFAVNLEHLESYTAVSSSGTGTVYYLSDSFTYQTALNERLNLKNQLVDYDLITTDTVADGDSIESDLYMRSFDTNPNMTSILYVPEKKYTVRGKEVRYYFQLVKTPTSMVFKVLSDKKALFSYPTASFGFEYPVSKEQLRIGTGGDAAAGDDSYEVNPDAPYGTVWRKTRPPGYPKEGPKVSTPSSGRTFMVSIIDDFPARLAQVPDLVPIVAWLGQGTNMQELKTTLVGVSRAESANQLYLPRNDFDIRNPVPPGQTDSLNLLDEGPFPRSSRGLVINSAKRPSDREYASDCGCFQYTAGTFRNLLAKWNQYVDSGIADSAVRTSFVWDTPPHVQVLLQSYEILEKVYIPSTEANIPAAYRAILVYLQNAMPVPAEKFILEAKSVLSTQPNASDQDRHLICKRIYDQGDWWKITQTPLSPDKYEQRKRFANNCSYNIAWSKWGIVQKNPSLFQTNKALLPNTPKKIRRRR